MGGPWENLKAIVVAELETGGTGPPCPFCGLARARRSDYIRCVRCGINWIGTEALDRDPRVERLRRFLADCQSQKKPPGREAAEGGTGKTVGLK